MRYKDDNLFLAEIQSSIQRIEDYTKGGKEEFLSSPLIQDAVLRNFQIVGEATKKLSEELKQANHQIPWRDIARFRDMLVHRYTHLTISEVWKIIERDIPELKRKIQELQKQLSKSE